jgi:nucleoside-diphosphate-sugar epimerase
VSAPTALVAGAGGFVAGYLVERLKADGFHVVGVDLKEPEFRATTADEFVLADLRDAEACCALFAGRTFDHVYQLAADMGGMEFIHASDAEILHNSALVNLNMVAAAADADVGRYFFSSSVCVYRDMEVGEGALTEDDAYPAQPDNEYGWEKLYAEHVLLATARHGAMKARIARFENTFGPYGTWRGGREKAPAAICRKVAELGPGGGEIDAFGDGTAVRNFTFVDDLVDGIRLLIESDEERPTNLGTTEYVTVAQLIDTVADAAGVEVKVNWIDGPVGVASRNFSKARAESLGFHAHHDLAAGIAATYPWIADQVAATNA